MNLKCEESSILDVGGKPQLGKPFVHCSIVDYEAQAGDGAQAEV